MQDEIQVPVESGSNLREDRYPESRPQMMLAREHASAASASSAEPATLSALECTSFAASMRPLLDLSQEQIAAIIRTVPGGTDNIQDVYPLAPLQEGMLFHRLLNKQVDTYILSALFALQSREHADVLIDALQKVIDRHDVLRTAVLWEQSSRPVQVVHRRARLRVQHLVLDCDRDPLEQLHESMRPERQSMDLREAPLMQLRLASTPGGGQWYAILHVHHIVCDHQTLTHIIAEALRHVSHRADSGVVTPMPFRDYVAHALERGAAGDAEAFFRRKLGDVDEPTAPFGVMDVHGDGGQLTEARAALEPTAAEQLRVQARRCGVSPGRLFHAAWALVVARTTARDDVVFGTVLLARNRRSAPAQRMLGMSVNTLPLRLRIGSATVREFVERSQQEISELLSYEHVPLTLAQRCSAIGGAAPLFTSLLNFRRSIADPPSENLMANGVEVLRRGEAWTNYPITMIVDDLGEGFALTAQADQRIDPLKIVTYLQTAVHSLAEALEHAPQTPAMALAVLPDEERRRVLESFNATRAPYPIEKLIHELFEEQVERTPHAVAVVSAGQYLTYRQLNSRANQLARHLRGQGAAAERFVGLCVERGIDMVVGILGILKSGAAYVPLDANYPQQRLEYILADANPVAVVVHDGLRQRLPAGRRMIAVDTQWNEIAAHAAADLPRAESGVSSSNIAYVIYTSGSTGQPKGVAIEHRNAVNLIWWGQSAMPAEVFDETLHSTSLNFDLSVYECFVPLSSGGMLRVVPNALALLTEPGTVTLINTVPSAIKSILDSGGVPPTTRVVNLAGEALKQELVERIFASTTVERVCNLYGPSETTTYSTWVSMPREEGFNPTIGHPIANTQIYILDAYRQPLPIGVSGEIFIGGAGVARGYLNKPDLTRQRFIADPFSPEPGARLYATGDLGRWRSDGAIEYLGRNDHQVKIRGFRIELAEIEAQLVRHELVREAAVIAREDVSGDKRLAAYVVVCEPARSPSADELREYLKTRLPEYMVPSAFMILERLPLTSNGKLDRRALPEPALSAYTSRRYEAPQGEIEELLAGIWQTLLGVERVGRQDNFFELGGHSLLMVQVMERLRRVGLFTEVRSMFDSPTLADLARGLGHAAAEQPEIPPNLIPDGCEALTPQMLPMVQLRPEEIESIVRSVPGGAGNIQDIYPLAPLQEGILFHHLLAAEGGDTYILQSVLSVSSRARVSELIAAVQAVIDRHDVLRTAVLWEHLPLPVQVVCRHATLLVEETVLDRARDEAEQIRNWIRPERQRLDLRRAPLVRLKVAVDEAGGRWYAVVQVHHITIDHVTLELLTADIVAQLEGGEHPPISATPYRNHVAQALSNARKHDADAFFRGKLADVDEPTAPFALLDAHGDGSQIEEASEELEPALAQHLRVLARRSTVSAATLFHAAWALVVAHTSGRDDVVFGSVLLGRLQGEAGAQQILGMFINTLPLRLRLQGLTARELLQQTQRELVEVLGHEQASLALAQRCSGLSGSAPLFTALLNYRHSVSTLEAQWAKADGIRMLVGQERTNYPITVSVDDLAAGFTLTAKTDRRIDPRRMLAYLRTAVQSLVEALDRSPQTPALALPILPPHERDRVVHTFNATQVEYPHDRLIHELFEDQAKRWPQRIAVVYQDESLTFGELERKSNQLAHYLRDHGVGAGVLVGLCVERSLELVYAVLGILKAGGAYVPLDPDYPAERLAYMLENAAPKVVLTQARLRSRLPGGTPVLALDEQADEISRRPATNPDARACGLRSSDLAYVIYTSGSTGQPKGVMIEHRNVLSLWQGIERIYARSRPCERIAVNASFNFDASVKQLVQLLSGRCVVLVPQDLRWDSAQLLRFIDESQVDGIDCTPWQLRSWLAAGLLEGDRRKLRVALIGGESIDAELWSSLAGSGETDFVNVYGPTESTVDTTFARLSGDSGAPHIGAPMENRRVYILGLHGQPAPIGVAGEMYIAGAGIARGYLNRTDLTEQYFLRDPFAEDCAARMYRSGDLGRWRADGTIEYVGRSDHQVKIRGFRIELGEVEARLAQHEQVEQAAVIVREDVPHDKRLVAYIVAAAGPNPAIETLRLHVRAVLPDYMVPSAFVILEQIPLTPSGKLDKRALPAPELQAYSSRRYEAPQGEVEELLASIWQGLLSVERVGRHDNFFELGGHSLMIVQMMELLRRAGLATEVRRVFETPTLMDLAGALSRARIEQYEVPANLLLPGCEAITPEMLPLVELAQQDIDRVVRHVPGGAANIQDIYPLAPLQEGIFFHHLLSEKGADTYIVLMLLSVASQERLEQLIAALQAVIDRHDILRTAILWEGLPQPVQVVHRRATLPVGQLLLEPGRDPAQQIRESARLEQLRIDPSRAPLIGLQVADGEGECRYALLQLHHIVSDHVTLEIAISEIVAHLEQRAHALPISAPYRNHVAQAIAYARTQDTEAFFRGKLAGIDEPTASFGLLDVHADGTRIDEASLVVEPGLARSVRVQARRLGVSAATLFHAAWGLVVAHTSGRDDVAFGTVLLGRLQGGAGAQRILGMFINTLPLRIQLKGMRVRELIEHTQRELVELLAQEQASLAVAQRCSSIVGSAPLFTSLFNYRHSANSADLWSASGVEMIAVRERTNYPITFSVDDLTDGFSFTVQTDARIDARRVTQYMHSAVESLVQALDQPLPVLALALSILPHSEQLLVVKGFNATAMPLPRERLIHQLFEAQARRTPDSIALIHGERRLTYLELNAKANQLARYLRERGVCREHPVGICMERSPEMVLGVLAILKAGAAYVPLDPSYPAERLRYMIEDAAPKIVLSADSLSAAVPQDGAEVIAVDAALDESAAYAATDCDVAELHTTGEDLVYVIYTSGSTGRPKGTAMQHRAMVNLIEWHRRELPLAEGQRVLQFAALSFDVAFQETFSTLCLGGTLVLLDEWVRRDARALTELLNSQRVERLFVPPLMLQSLAECFQMTREAPATLKDVITAGEQLRLSAEIVDFFERLADCRLHNHYGPTETHVVTALTLSGDPAAWPPVPTIGQPIANTQIYLLDARRQPVPIGVTGEIYIAGANVARGYLNRPELTAERFLSDPFSDSPAARMYKTGDLGRWRADGSMEYLGRNDHQVKIRGYRIELDEIEAQLALHAQVAKAVAIVREDVPGEKRLVAYVVPRRRPGPSPEELRAHVKGALPEHMVPSAFVILDTLPQTPTGKLDRRALPAPQIGSQGSQRYQPPQGVTEQALAEIWQRLLGAGRVSRDDNFFELGGHSLLVLKALFEIRRALGCTLKVTDLYRSPSVRELAQRIHDGAERDELIDLSREAVLDAGIIALPGPSCVAQESILVTGCTGFVGRFLLARLLEETSAKIYCLVRCQSRQQAWTRLRSTLLQWDLWREEFDDRIVAVNGDLRLPRLGIDVPIYEDLCRRVDSIYHCATSMNHLETYSMARAANVEGAKELVKIAARYKPKLINYLSTLGIFGAPATAVLPVITEDASIERGQYRHSEGYMASKWVGEKIFMLARERQIPCNIFRLGLVWADTALGRFDELQNVYRVLKTSLLAGCGIAGFRYPMAPTPVDYVARAVVHLAGRYTEGQGVFHISSAGHPIQGVFERCNDILGTSLELVSYYEWIGQIKRLHQAGLSLPAVPLIEFAFSMDRATFDRYQQTRRSTANVHFDFSKTHRQLESAGIVAPMVDEHLLNLCLRSMLSRDTDLRERLGGGFDDLQTQFDPSDLSDAARVSEGHVVRRDALR
jgi:amino acid adenylation domain-containing protein/thioester reductase-like protein